MTTPAPPPRLVETSTVRAPRPAATTATTGGSDTATSHAPTVAGTTIPPRIVDTGTAAVGRNVVVRATPSATPTSTTVRSATPRAGYPTAPATDIGYAFDPVVLVDDRAFDDAIRDVDRAPVFTLRADWGRTGLFDHPYSDLTDWVAEVTVERDLEGALPVEVGLVDGSTAAALTVTLVGREDPDSPDPVDVFAPYRPGAPLYAASLLRTPIELETGFVTDDGPRLDRRFTGVVTSIKPTSSSRSVQITALDAAHQLRETVTLPGSAMFGDVLARYGPDTYRTTINTQWVVDYVLRRNGIYASPPPRPEAILSATGHGSMIPEIGWGGAPQDIYPTYRGDMWRVGPFGMLFAAGQTAGRWWLEEPLTAASGTGFGMSMHLAMYPATGADRILATIDITTDQSLFLRLGILPDGRPFLGFQRVGQGEDRVVPGQWQPPTNPQFKFLGVHTVFADTSMTVRWRIDRRLYTITVPIAARAANWSPQASITYQWLNPVVCFQLWNSLTPPNAGAWSGEDWVPQADIDPGSNQLMGLPELIGVESRDILDGVCAAEGSVLEITEGGRHRFRTRAGDALRGDTPEIVDTLHADTNLADLVATFDESTVRNTINIKTKSLSISPYVDYYTSPDIAAFDSPPGTTYFELALPTAAYEVPPPRSTFGSKNGPGAWRNAGGDGFIYFDTNEAWGNAEKNKNNAGFIRCMLVNATNPLQVVVDGVQIRLVRKTPWRLQVIVNNQKSYTVRFATLGQQDTDTGAVSDGEPALIIPARVVEQGDEQLETLTDNDSVAIYGAASYTVGGDDERWRQLPEPLRGLASSVLAATARPVPVLDAVDVPHDPRRRLRQRVLLADPDGLGEVAATIVGLVQAYTPSGASDRVTVRPIAPPGLGLLDDPSVGLLDVSLVLG